MSEVDPFGQLSDEDMLALYSGIQGQLPGGKPKDRLSFLSSMSNMLGFNPVALAGVENPDPKAADPFVDPGNVTSETYAGNPLYDTIFQMIDQGADPVTAVKKAKDSGQFGSIWTAEDEKQNLQIAVDYKKEEVGRTQAQQAWDTKTSAKTAAYTAPDGSKYKQSPMGGNDINGFASEYDLLGAPSEQDLISEYAASVKPKAASASETARMIREQSGRSAQPQMGQRADGFGWGATMPVAASQDMGDTTGRVAPGLGGGAWSAWAKAGGLKMPQTATKSKGQFSDNSEVEKYAQQEAKFQAKTRVGRSKNTMVRSDANRNAMARVAALLTMIQGTSK